MGTLTGEQKGDPDTSNGTESRVTSNLIVKAMRGGGRQEYSTRFCFWAVEVAIRFWVLFSNAHFHILSIPNPVVRNIRFHLPINCSFFVFILDSPGMRRLRVGKARRVGLPHTFTSFIKCLMSCPTKGPLGGAIPPRRGGVQGVGTRTCMTWIHNPSCFVTLRVCRH